MTENVIVEMIGALALIVVAVLQLRAETERKRRHKADTQREKKEELKEKDRLEGEAVKLDLLLASAKLSYATTMALQRGKTNGEVEPAVEQYNKAISKFQEFERKQITKLAAD